MHVAALELLNDLGRHDEAWQFNRQPSRSDALLIQAIRSARALQRPEAQALSNEFSLRLAHQQQRGDIINERPVIVFQLEVLDRPDQALALAQSAWATQREPADASLYARAAIRMKDRSAAQALLAWRVQTGYREPQLDALINALQAISGGTETRPRP
jgi:TPR repeat protein